MEQFSNRVNTSKNLTADLRNLSAEFKCDLLASCILKLVDKRSV